MNVINGTNLPDSSDMSSADMSALVTRLLDKHGPSLLKDRGRLYGLLRDYAPSQLRKTKLMMTAYDQGVPQNFAVEATTPTSFAVAQATQSIIVEAGIQTELAQWATEAWLGALFPSKPQLVPPLQAAIAPVVPRVPELATSGDTANNLTWGESEPVVSPAIPIAPSAVTNAQMNMAPMAQAGALPAPAIPAAVDTRQLHLKKSGALKSLSALIITIVIAGVGAFYYNNYENSSSSEAPNPQPVEQPVAPPPSTAPSAPNVVVLSTSNDEKSWPIYANGGLLNATPNTWQFRFNLRHPNGHIYGYTTSVRLQDNLKAGQAIVSAADFQNYKAEAVSESPPFAVSRVLSDDKKSYITVANMSGWQKNLAQAPLICLKFTSGATAYKFEPDHGYFCVDEFANNACGANLGCGRLQ